MCNPLAVCEGSRLTRDAGELKRGVHFFYPSNATQSFGAGITSGAFLFAPVLERRQSNRLFVALEGYPSICLQGHVTITRRGDSAATRIGDHPPAVIGDER